MTPHICVIRPGARRSPAVVTLCGAPHTSQDVSLHDARIQDPRDLRTVCPACRDWLALLDSPEVP